MVHPVPAEVRELLLANGHPTCPSNGPRQMGVFQFVRRDGPRGKSTVGKSREKGMGAPDRRIEVSKHEVNEMAYPHGRGARDPAMRSIDCEVRGRVPWSRSDRIEVEAYDAIENHLAGVAVRVDIKQVDQWFDK